MQSANLDWFQIAALLGAIQGVFLAGALATQRRNRTANRLLAVATIAFCIHMLTIVYHAMQWEQVFPHFLGAAYPLPFVYGPLIFLYAVAASDRARGLRRSDLLHFLPFIAVLVVVGPIYLTSGAEKLAFYHELKNGLRPPPLGGLDPLKYVSGISYVAATFIFLRRHRAGVEDRCSSIEQVNLRWLVWLAAAVAVIWLLATTFHLTATVNHPLLEHDDEVVALAIAVLVYGMGYMALRRPEILSLAATPSGGHRTWGPMQGVPNNGRRSSTGDSPARYERSGLTQADASTLKERLLAMMDDERPYRDCDLTLTDLAAHLRTTPHRLSEVLNSQLDLNFYDFVNGYRVRDVQRRIAEERSRNVTLLSIALDAGFASKSTFNHAFKKLTGETPSAYRKSVDG